MKLYELYELFEIYEMTTVGPKTHRFGIDIKLHILQPADKQLPHGPRVKIIKVGVEKDFSITLNEDPAKMEPVGDYLEVISKKQYNTLFKQVQKYRIPFLNMWYHPFMDQDELRAEMDAIDAGETIELRKAEK